MEQRICPVMGTTWEKSIMLDTRLRKRFEPKTITGYEPCEEVKNQLKTHVVIVEIDLEKSGKPSDGKFNPSNAYRTGRISYLKDETYLNIFGKIPNGKIAYGDNELIDFLQSKVN